MSLTPRGARLREQLKDVFAELEQILRELDQTREVTGTVKLAASTTLARHFVPRIFVRLRHYHPDAGLQLIVRNTEEVLDDLRKNRVGLGLVEGHQRSPGIRLKQFMSDEIVPVFAARISDPKLRRAIERVKCARDLETLARVWSRYASCPRKRIASSYPSFSICASQARVHFGRGLRQELHPGAQFTDDRFIEQSSEKKLDDCDRKRCGRNTERKKVNPGHR